MWIYLKIVKHYPCVSVLRCLYKRLGKIFHAGLVAKNLLGGEISCVYFKAVYFLHSFQEILSETFGRVNTKIIKPAVFA